MKSPAFIKRMFAPAASSDSKADRHTRKTVALCHALLSERGEASGAALAREALESYRLLSGPALRAFFDVLAQEFSPDPEAVGEAAEAYRQDASQAKLIRLQNVVESPRQELFRRFNLAAGGTVALVEMRRRVLRELRAQPHWAGIDADLVHLLGSWFNRGFLSLQRIDWRTPALVLEKLMQYEAVHEIQGWRDLRRRPRGSSSPGSPHYFRTGAPANLASPICWSRFSTPMRFMFASALLTQAIQSGTAKKQ